MWSSYYINGHSSCPFRKFWWSQDYQDFSLEEELIVKAWKTQTKGKAWKKTKNKEQLYKINAYLSCKYIWGKNNERWDGLSLALLGMLLPLLTLLAEICNILQVSPDLKYQYFFKSHSSSNGHSESARCSGKDVNSHPQIYPTFYNPNAYALFGVIWAIQSLYCFLMMSYSQSNFF